MRREAEGSTGPVTDARLGENRDAAPDTLAAASPRRSSSAAFLAALLLLALAHVGLAAWSAFTHSVTMDEAGHIVAGAMIWQQRDVAVYSANPPTIRLLATAPLLGLGPDVPDGGDGPSRDIVALQRQFEASNAPRYESLIPACRLPIALLGGLAVLIVGIEARAMGSARAGLAAAALLAFEPTFLAHASLATVDAGAATIALAWTAAVRRSAERPTAGWIGLTGLLAGLAVGAKYSLVILAPMLLAMLFLRAPKLRTPRGIAMVAGAWIIGGLLVLDACWMFQGLGARNGRPNRLESTALRVLESEPVRHVPLPVPNDMLEGLDQLLVFKEDGWGRSVHASLDAFLYVRSALVKLTCPWLILLLFVFVSRATRRAAWPYLVSALGFFVVLSLQHHMPGLRLVLPCIPLLAVPLGLEVDRWLSAGGAVRAAGIALLVGHGAGTLMTAPDFLPHANVVARATGIDASLTDSDVDWGQDLPELRGWMREQGIDEIPLLYYGAIDPRTYGVHFQYPEPATTRAPVAISMAYLRGANLHVREGRLVEVPADYLAAHRAAEPDLVLGGSIAIYTRPVVARP